MSKRDRVTSSFGGTGKHSSKKKAKTIKGTMSHAKSASSTHVAPSVQAAVDAAVINEKKRNAKFADLAAATYACDTTGAIALVATMAQGASQNQRIGKKALYKSVQFRGTIYSNSATTVSDAAVLLVYDRDPTGLLPAITDILNTSSSVSFNNDTNSDRFKIVRRWDYSFVGNSTTPSTGMEMQGFDHYVDLRNLPCQFSNVGTGAIGDIKKGALYLVTVGINGPGTGAVTLQCGARTRFIDLE